MSVRISPDEGIKVASPNSGETVITCSETGSPEITLVKVATNRPGSTELILVVGVPSIELKS